MTLIRVWAADFATAGYLNLLSCFASDSERNAVLGYAALNRYRHPSEHYWYGGMSGDLWRDENHSQVSKLYLPFISFAAAAGGALVPQSAKIPDTVVNLMGAEWRQSVLGNNLHLPKSVQLTTLFQGFDTRAFSGRGTNVNYIYNGQQSLCEALGYQSPYRRPAQGETRTTGWVDYVTCFDPQWWEPIDGNAAKVAAEVYGRSITAEAAMATQLLNIMTVFHCGKDTPALQPTSRPGGGWGELYCRKAELWVDSELNTDAVAV